MRPLYTIKRLGFVKIFLAALYLFSGCGMQQASKQSFDSTDLLTTFPACFSMQATLHFMGLHHTFRCRLACCVTYDQQIDFIVKGPLGIEIMRGLIDKKGVTVVDRLRRVVHQWDYKRIKQQYHFPCDYSFIQLLFLGMDPIEHGVPDSFCSNVTYIYDGLTRKVVAVQLIDIKRGNSFKFLYRHKMVVDRSCLSGMKIDFLLRDKGKLYQGRATLHKLHFKELKRPNIRLIIPAYYRKESSKSTPLPVQRCGNVTK